MEPKSISSEKDDYNHCSHLKGMVSDISTANTNILQYSTAHKATVNELLQQIHILQLKKLNGQQEFKDNFNDLIDHLVQIITSYGSKDSEDQIYLYCTVFNIGIAQLFKKNCIRTFLRNECFICWTLGTEICIGLF